MTDSSAEDKLVFLNCSERPPISGENEKPREIIVHVEWHINERHQSYFTELYIYLVHIFCCCCFSLETDGF